MHPLILALPPAISSSSPPSPSYFLRPDVLNLSHSLCISVCQHDHMPELPIIPPMFVIIVLSLQINPESWQQDVFPLSLSLHLPPAGLVVYLPSSRYYSLQPSLSVPCFTLII